MAPSDPSTGSEKTTSAPYVRAVWMRGALTFPGITRVQRSPSAEQIQA